MTLLLAATVVIGLYLRGYARPAHHPLPPSIGAVASSTLMYLSLAVFPGIPSYWWPARPISVALVVATLVLLAIAGYRTPDERPRALGLMAVICSMLCVGVAVGVSRTGLGPGAILASRYVTLTIPMLCALSVAWLLYARGPARAAVHLGLVALLGLAFPAGHRFSREYGAHVRAIEIRVEHCLTAHVPTAVLLSRACPALFPDVAVAQESFRMLRAAGVGAFKEFEEDRVASTPEAAGAVRR